MNLVDSIVAVLGLLLITVVPGFFLSLIIFRDHKFTLVERICISSAINISLVIIIALLLDMVLGVDITAENVVKSLLVVTILSIFVWVLEPHRIKKISKIRA
jgi:uncharacterized membrane protein